MVKGKGALVTRSAFCQALGATKYQFDCWLAEGMPVHQRPKSRGANFQVHVGECVDWLIARARVTKEGPDPDQERALLYRERRIKIAQENARPCGELVRKSDVLAARAVACTAIRDRIRAVTSVAPLLRQAALEGGEAAVARALDQAICEALVELAAP